MSKSVNKKVIKKDVKYEKSDTESDSTESIDSVDSHDGFDDLNISKNDLEQLDINNKDMYIYYYNKNNNKIYCQSTKTHKWSIIDNSKYEKIMKLCKIEQIKSDKKVIENNVRPKRKTKNEIYVKDQNTLFEDLKNIIEVKSNGVFTSETLWKKNDQITGDILERFKKYYDTNMSRGIDGKDTRASISIIKKIFKYHGYEIIGQQSKCLESQKEKCMKYVMVKIED